MTTTNFIQKYKEMTKSFKLLCGFHLAVFILLIIGCGGCGGVREATDNKKAQGFISQPENKNLKEDNKHVVKEATETFKNSVNHLPIEQQNILLRRDFNRSIKTFDTTNLSLTDTIPFRFIEKNYKRMPLYRTLGLREMNRDIDAAYHGQDYDRKLSYLERYPGIVIVSNDRKGWEEIIEYYNDKKELVNTFDIQKYNPYYEDEVCKKKGIKSGAVDGENIEDISDPMTMRGKDFRKEAQNFVTYGEVQPQSTSDLTPIIYKLYGVKDGICIGFETMVVVIDPKGKEIFRRQFPVNVYVRIPIGNKYIILQPDEYYVPYMTDGWKQKEYFVLHSLITQKEVYKIELENGFGASGSEQWHENLIEIIIHGIDPNKDRVKRVFIDLNTLTKFEVPEENFKMVIYKDPMLFPIFTISKI